MNCAMLRETYNYHLYRRRLELGLSRRHMAKGIGMSTFKYRMIENGYWKPSAAAIEKISAFLHEDYSLFVEGACSNPSNLPEKMPSKPIQALYAFMGNWITRGILIGLTVLSGLYFASGLIVENYVETNKSSFYDKDYIDFADEVRINGIVSYALLGDFQRPELYEVSSDEDTGRDKCIRVRGFYGESSFQTLSYSAVYRSEECRADFSALSYDPTDKLLRLNVEVAVFETSKTENHFLSIDSSGTIVDHLCFVEKPVGLALVQLKAPKFEKDVTRLMQSQTTTTLDVRTALYKHDLGEERANGYYLYSFAADILGMLSTAIFLFATVFSLLYGRSMGEKHRFTHDHFEVEIEPTPPMKPLKKDIRFGPFIPETFLEIVGIILVFVGSLRLAVYVSGFFGFSSLGQALAGNSAQNFMGTFMVGMFLLYFLDFDIFLEDRRVARNIFLYGIIFFCLYRLELLLLEVMQSGVALSMATSSVVIPNMFSSISCYFMIMLFLFFLPRFVKKPYQVVLWRCLAILPIAYLAISWILFHGDGVWFNIGWSLEVKYLFNGERLPFTVLAVSYLVGYYFLRLFFEKRYGKENAAAFYNSNRFLWIKNVFMALVIVGVALGEFALRDNATAHKLDIGNYANLIVLAPVFLFYHPHKGPRNKAVDYLTLFLYILALMIAYTIIGLIAILGFALSLSE